ncbi:helix-turn-helix transcriptional regulator [Streptomyces sp. NPDC032161]|uniref:response regulator transcription factor n=1 Tax=unclassified Streptomyces TaxID=2593676 RepID=UPI00340E62D8
MVELGYRPGPGAVDVRLDGPGTETASPLTPCESEILRLAAQGMSAAETAADLSVRTVRNHLSLATGKLHARTLVDAVRIAERHGWI